MTVILDPTREPIDYDLVDVSQWGTVHFIGIGGAGMSVLAEMLIERGVSVSGSDKAANDKIDKLKALGACVYEGHDGSHVDKASIVVYSSAIKPDNPEIIAAQERGLLILHRSDILAVLMAHRQAITVAGAHGKTTTSAMIAQIFTSTGKGELADPSYAIGGSVYDANGPKDGGHAGSGQIFVAEADESDGSFEKYRPSIAVMTNVEPDHLDHYGDAQEFYNAFVRYSHHAVNHVVACADDEGAYRVVSSLDESARARAVVYTSNPDLTSIASDGMRVVQITRLERQSESTHGESFTVYCPELFTDTPVQAHIQVPGMHNVKNATAALICAVLSGMGIDEAVKGLLDFRGAARRFDIRGSVNGITVVDDYAHHPTEVAALLQAARDRYPHSTIRVIFQPHLFSRTKFFAQEFANALSVADTAVVTGIYPARERAQDWPSVSPRTIVDYDASGERLIAIDDMYEAATYVASQAGQGDVIFTVGAGSVTVLGDAIMQQLNSTAETAMKTAMNGEE